MDEIMANILAERETQKAKAQTAPEQAMIGLRELGVALCVMTYEGGGDQGGPDKYVLTYADGRVEESTDYPGFGLPAGLADLIYSPIGAKHGSWADGGGYSASGVVIYDVLGEKAIWKEVEELTNHYEHESDLLDGEIDFDFGGDGE